MIADCLFPGGNILVEKIEGRDVFLRQDQRGSTEPWFYWYFRLRGAGGEGVVGHFTDWNVIGVRGPAVSLDAGRSWTWAGAECVKDASFHYYVPPGVDEIRFAFTIPYLQTDLEKFLAVRAGDARLKKEILCRSRKGREVEMLRLGPLNEQPIHRVLLTARHHACESMASFVLEGILDCMLSDTPAGRWFQQTVECLALPFLDKDGVEDGDQGKTRPPYDHNRDYAGESIYPEARAHRQLAAAWAGGKLGMALDLHCPWIRGGRNEEIFFVGGEDPRIWAEIGAFCQILEQVQQGPLRYSSRNNLDFGIEWNVEAPPGQMSADRWWREMGWRGSTIEIPYANAGGQEVNPGSARALGQDLGAALHAYLRGTPAR